MKLSDCSHEIKRRLLLERKAMTILDSILKRRDIILSTKVHLVKAMVFPVWIWEFNWESWESWAPKNWCFWTVVLEESPLDCKEIQPVNPKGLILESLRILSNLKKSVLNVHWKDWCWSWNSNPLATWCEEWTHLKRPWCWERLKAGGEGDNKGWDGWMVSPTQWTWVWVNSGSWWWTGRPGVLQSMGSQRVRQDGATELNCS